MNTTLYSPRQWKVQSAGALKTKTLTRCKELAVIISKKDKLYYVGACSWFMQDFPLLLKRRMLVITDTILNKKITKVLDVRHSLARGN